MTLKVSFKKNVIIKWYWQHLIHYCYILFFIKYYSINCGNTFRIDVKTTPRNIKIFCLKDGELLNSKKKGRLHRYFLTSKMIREVSVSISISGNELSFPVKVIPRHPLNHCVLVFIGIFLLILPILLVYYFSNNVNSLIRKFQ